MKVAQTPKDGPLSCLEWSKGDGSSVTEKSALLIFIHRNCCVAHEWLVR